MTAFILSSTLLVWITDQLRRVRERLEVAMNELQHRGKNTFAVVQSIVHHSLAGHPELAKTIAERIKSVSSTNDLIAQKPSTMTVGLRELLDAKFNSFSCEINGCPRILLRAESARALSLIVHELRTKQTPKNTGRCRKPTVWF